MRLRPSSRRKKTLPQSPSSPPLPQEAAVSGASLQTPRAVAAPQPLPQRQGRSLAETRNATTPEPAPPSGPYLRMAISAARLMASITTSHARDGVWSCEGVMCPHRFTKVAYYGSMTHILTSHLVSLPDRQSPRKAVTQCPGIITQQCPGITNKQCPGITMR